MADDIRATGYINLLLAIDLGAFMDAPQRAQFETIRGYRQLADTLRGDWARRLTADKRSAFMLVDDDIALAGSSASMSTDEVGFVTGIFRSNMLDLYSAPLYRVDKTRFVFSDAVKNNLQFKNLFAPVWRSWDIYVRPTMTGMLVVRLVRAYQKPTDLLRQAIDVIELQTPFDVPAAIKVLHRLQVELADPALAPAARAATEQKIAETREFLAWLGVNDLAHPELDYIPTQWQLAIEIGQRLVSEIGGALTLADGQRIPFSTQKPDLSSTLYDSYTIYHLDELLAEAGMLTPLGGGGDDPDEPDDTDTQELTSAGRQVKNLVRVEPSDVKRSIRIKWCLVGLVEGAILSRVIKNPRTKMKETRRRFPRHNLEVVEQVFGQDIATWSDELCLLTSRVGIVMPSRRASKEQLFVSRLDAKTTTTYVEYPRYWEALERLIEFVVEISILGRLVETTSADTLQQFVQELDRARKNILHGRLNGATQDNQRRLIALTNQSANLSRLVGLCQGLTNPAFWSRAEYAVEKAQHLMSAMGSKLLVGHAERNVANLTNLVDHVDEIYLAQLSERSNEQNSRQSVILAGLSLTIILFTLPSFWADLEALGGLGGLLGFIQRGDLLNMLGLLGSILAPVIFIGSVLMLVLVITPNRLKFWRRRRPRGAAQRDRPPRSLP